MCAVVRPAVEVIGVLVARDGATPLDELLLQREAERAYEYADESLGRPAGLTRPGG
jgi:hypothetical protein